MDSEGNVENVNILKESSRTYVTLQVEESEVSGIHPLATDSDEAQSERNDMCPGSPELSIDDLDSKISLACTDAKQKINEIFSLKSTFLEQYDILVKQEQNKFIEELKKNSEELRKIKLLAETYLSTVRFKEDIIGNLVEALQKQKNKHDSCKAFYAWRIQHLDTQREKFLCAIASNHYANQLKRRVLNSWRAAIEMSWRERIEYRVRLHIQERHELVVDEYEAKIRRLEEALKESNEKIEALQSNHKSYEDMMKQALMRGVCALNVEAMSVLYTSPEMSTQTTLPCPSMPHLPCHQEEQSNIASDISSIHPCPDCFHCPSEILSERTVKCVSSRKDLAREQGAVPKAPKIHHSSALKSMPVMGTTTNVSSYLSKTRHRCLDKVPCQIPNISVERHIDKSTSSISSGLRSTGSRSQLRRS